MEYEEVDERIEELMDMLDGAYHSLKVLKELIAQDKEQMALDGAQK